MSTWLANKASGLLASRTSRRGFLVRSALVGSALTVAPTDYLLKPRTAYHTICGCANMGCDCGAACCGGFTHFCCSINGGLNVCPKGTFLGGWWKADGSTYCSGPRYYMDCNAYCSCTSVSYESFCEPQCDGLTCECALGSCDNMHVGCAQFRYGQCHQEIAISGRILCRVISCTPPWELDSTCTTTLAVDDGTAEHNAPCLEALPAFVTMAVMPRPYDGYWLADTGGTIHAFGEATDLGGGGGSIFGEPVVSMSATPSGKGYFLSGSAGDVFVYGDAVFHGAPGANGIIPPSPIVGMAGTPSGSGYWLAASDGGVFSFGDAGFHGSMGGVTLDAPIVGMAGTPSGSGYWLAASDGGVFSFGDAGFHGSMGGVTLDAPIVGMAGTPSGSGYWLAASDGGVFSFGDAGFHGSMGGVTLDAPIVGMAGTPSGSGYWLAASDGGVFSFGDATFHGSAA